SDRPSWTLLGRARLALYRYHGRAGAPLQQAAVYRQDLTRDVARLVRGEERHRARDLLGGPDATARRQVDHARADLLRHVRRQVGRDEAGRHRVDRDAPVAVLLGHRLGEADDPGLGRGVVRLAGGADDPRDRRHVDDAAVPLLDHLAQGGPAAVEDALQI